MGIHHLLKADFNAIDYREQHSNRIYFLCYSFNFRYFLLLLLKIQNLDCLYLHLTFK